MIRVATVLLALVCTEPLLAADRPNVILIVLDDLNDSVEGFGGHPQARTPNMARLAEQGVRFTRAYSNNPVCAPSRASFMSGIQGHTSGNMWFEKWFENEILANSRTIPEQFRRHGYFVAGTGKVQHHGRRNLWTAYGHDADYGPSPFDGEEAVGHPSVPEPFRSIGPIDGSFGPLSDVPFGGADGAGWLVGPWGDRRVMRYVDEDDRELLPDEKNAAWAADFINERAESGDERPFFLAVGFIRPHTPMHAPQKYFDMFPIDEVRLSPMLTGDMDDTHLRDVMSSEEKGFRYFRKISEAYGSTEAGLRAFTQAYLACVAAADDCVGKVIDALDASPFRDNTIVVVTSDHGFNLGEKGFLFKNSTWEESLRVPLIVRAPEQTARGVVCGVPVSLIDLFPTLLDLCGLPTDTVKNEKGRPLDGHSFAGLVADPIAGSWDGPEGALSMVRYSEEIEDAGPVSHWSVRTERWRYTLYSNGAEELYDHDSDLHEWHNLAADETRSDEKRRLRAMIYEQVSRTANPAGLVADPALLR